MDSTDRHSGAGAEERKSTNNNRHNNGDVDSGPRRIHPLRRALPQILATTAKNILLLGYGMTLGFPTIVIPNVQEPETVIGNQTVTIASDAAHHHDQLYLTKAQISWFSSMNLFFVPVGSLLSGVLTQPFGRKPSMIAVNVPFIVAWILFYYASNVPMLYLALGITGFSGGVLEAPVLTYVAEITQPHLRGMLSASASMCVILGVFLQFMFGTFLPWRSVALLSIAFPVAAICALSLVPESPHWLIGRGRIQDAEKSLQCLRGWVSASEVQPELSVLVKSIQASATANQSAKSWQPFLQRTFLRPYGIVAFAFFAGHFGGMTTLQTYAVDIFTQLGTPMDKYVATMLLGLVQLVGTLVCVALVHWTGKRPLVLVSLLGQTVCLLVVAAYASWFFKHPSVTTYGWVPLTFLVAGALLTHMGIRLLPWILIGEVYTADTRGTASGASGSIGYIFASLANKTYFLTVDRFSLAGTFSFYAAISLVGAIVLFLVMPETEGRTLQEIQEHFAGTRNLLKEGRKQKRPKDVSKYASDNPAMDNNESNM